MWRLANLKVRRLDDAGGRPLGLPDDLGSEVDRILFPVSSNEHAAPFGWNPKRREPPTWDGPEGVFIAERERAV